MKVIPIEIDWAESDLVRREVGEKAVWIEELHPMDRIGRFVERRDSGFGNITEEWDKFSSEGLARLVTGQELVDSYPGEYPRKGHKPDRTILAKPDGSVMVMSDYYDTLSDKEMERIRGNSEERVEIMVYGNLGMFDSDAIESFYDKGLKELHFVDLSRRRDYVLTRTGEFDSFLGDNVESLRDMDAYVFQRLGSINDSWDEQEERLLSVCDNIGLDLKIISLEHPVDSIGMKREKAYEWQEGGARLEWAKSLSEKDEQAYSNYYGFGYRAMNEMLRGTPDDRLGLYGEEGVARCKQEILDLHEAISARGYELERDLVVTRGAYLPGISAEKLMSAKGKVMREPGFVSCFGFADDKSGIGYAGYAKWESIYQRFTRYDSTETIEKHQDETGTSVRFFIHVPKGTRVGCVESVRFNSKFPEGFPATYYGRESDKHASEECEILLDKDARFLVKGIRYGREYKSSDGSLKDVPVYDMFLEYIPNDYE